MEERTTFQKICQHCGREFTAYTSVTAYCSNRCANLADKLKKRNERLRETQADVLELHQATHMLKHAPRTDSNYRKNYIDGKYGAIPYFTNNNPIEENQ